MKDARKGAKIRFMGKLESDIMHGSGNSSGGMDADILSVTKGKNAACNHHVYRGQHGMELTSKTAVTARHSIPNLP